MLTKGTYKVIGLLDISRSLLSQKENSTVIPNNVHKVLLQSDKNVVAYFLSINFGPNSVIEIPNDLDVPIILDYKIIKKIEPSVNLKMINELLEIKKKEK